MAFARLYRSALYGNRSKKRKNPPYFFTKRNNKGKFPYGKRIAEWPKPEAWGVDIQPKSFQSSPDGSFLVVLRTLGTDHRIEEHAVWRLEK